MIFVLLGSLVLKVGLVFLLLCTRRISHSAAIAPFAYHWGLRLTFIVLQGLLHLPSSPFLLLINEYVFRVFHGVSVIGLTGFPDHNRESIVSQVEKLYPEIAVLSLDSPLAKSPDRRKSAYTILVGLLSVLRLLLGLAKEVLVEHRAVVLVEGRNLTWSFAVKMLVFPLVLVYDQGKSPFCSSNQTPFGPPCVPIEDMILDSDLSICASVVKGSLAREFAKQVFSEPKTS